jgi:hypothetical protein
MLARYSMGPIYFKVEQNIQHKIKLIKKTFDLCSINWLKKGTSTFHVALMYDMKRSGR